MGSAMSIGLIMGGLNAAGSLLQASRQNAELNAQAANAEQQARNYELMAKETADKGRVEAAQIDAQKSRLRRAYNETQGRNRSLLAAGNVDMTSGSAADSESGNVEMFAADMGDNAYNRILKEWETANNKARLEASAGAYHDQASSLRSQASGSWLPSLLNTAISGASGFASGYSLAGGSLKSLFGSSHKFGTANYPMAYKVIKHVK